MVVVAAAVATFAVVFAVAPVDGGAVAYDIHLAVAPVGAVATHHLCTF